MNNEMLKIVFDLTKQMIQSEHNFFVETGMDNSEHIPRIQRIARVSADFLQSKGFDDEVCRKHELEIIEYGRHLFVDEWLKPLDGDNGIFPDKNEAIGEFNRLLKKRKK